MAKLCECGCGTEMQGSSRWNYVRGHKPKSTALAKRGVDIVIDPPDDTVWVTCEVSVAQLNKIYSLLPPQQKGTAVLAGIEDLGVIR